LIFVEVKDKLQFFKTGRDKPIPSTIDFVTRINRSIKRMRKILKVRRKEMKRTQLIVILSFITGTILNAQIISQYIETSSGTTPKGVEIWNNTGGTLDFSTNNLVIEKGTNGAAPSTDYTLSSGTLTSGSSIVIGTSDLQATTEANSSVFYVKSFSYNGDDALVVKYGGTTTDVFGDPGTGDPGTGWSGSGVQSYNQNIALKSGISTGDTDGWTDPSTRFEVISSDNTMTGFGLSPGTSDTTPPSWTSTYPKGQTETASGFDVAVSLDESGTAYFVVLVDGATPAPSSAQVKAGTDGSDGALGSNLKGTINVVAASTEYTGSVSSLSASTAYDVYVVAEDDEGSPNLQASPTKKDVSTTVAASSPTASTSAANSVDHESATVNGSVTANNASTTVTFEYGLSDSYGSTATAAESPVSGSSATDVSVVISSLDASTIYHFRVKAVNSEGTTYGDDANFTTSSAPVAPTNGVIFISEVSDAGSSPNEFMELYNIGLSAIDLSSTKIVRFSSVGVYDSYTFDFGTDGSGSTIIPAEGFLVIGRAATQSSFESEWGALPEGVNYNNGTSNLYFGTGRQWAIKNGGTANTNDGTLIDETGEAVAVASNRSYQEPIGIWSSDAYSNGTPGVLDNDQSLPVVLSSWKATSSRGLVKLLWTTDSEIENQGFIIERSQKTEDRSQNSWKEISSFTTNPGLLGQGSTSAQNDYSYIDKQVKVGKSYSYRLSDVDYRGIIARHADLDVTVKDAGADLKPFDVQIHKAFPNPFNPDVNLSFTLENEVEELSLEIYNIQGALVQTLSSGYHEMGTHDFSWNGFDSGNAAVSSGVYLVRLSTGAVVQIQRVTLLR
jgi:hypothetical protein